MSKSHGGFHEAIPRPQIYGMPEKWHTSLSAITNDASKAVYYTANTLNTME